MSLFEFRRIRRTAFAATALAGAALTLQACQVQPLYYQNTSTLAPQSSTREMLASVAINPVGDRVALELRNELIFMFSGGAGEPANPEYTMQLQVKTQASRALRDGLLNGIVSRRILATAVYTISLTATGEEIYKGTRKVTTFYDQNTQEFANNRAMRDAENRAAQELAEIIRADTASVLIRRQAGS